MHPISDLLPHRPPMILLDALVEYDDAVAVTVTTIRDKSLFLQPDGVPAHIGLEYMAQACGAHAGALARDRGQPVKIGLLLGTRQYVAHVPYFRLGERLFVSVAMVYRDEQIGAFDCLIRIDGAVVAEAQLMVYQPNEIHALAHERGW